MCITFAIACFDAVLSFNILSFKDENLRIIKFIWPITNSPIFTFRESHACQRRQFRFWFQCLIFLWWSTLRQTFSFTFGEDTNLKAPCRKNFIIGFFVKRRVAMISHKLSFIKSCLAINLYSSIMNIINWGKRDLNSSHNFINSDPGKIQCPNLLLFPFRYKTTN